MEKYQGYTVDESDVLMPKTGTTAKYKVYRPKQIPLDGGKAIAQRHMKNAGTIALTVNDKLLAGYPIEERARQLKDEGKIYD